MEGGRKPALYVVPSSYRDTLRALVDRHMRRTLRYSNLVLSLDRTQLHEDVAAFEAAFRRAAANVGIPTYADMGNRAHAFQARLFVTGKSTEPPRPPEGDGRSICLYHATFGVDLIPKGWDLFCHIGQEVSDRMKLPLVNDREKSPWLWSLDRP